MHDEAPRTDECAGRSGSAGQDAAAVAYVLCATEP